MDLSINQINIRSSIYENCNVIDETFAKSGHVKINFMASKRYIKYFIEKGYGEEFEKNHKNQKKFMKLDNYSI